MLSKIISSLISSTFLNLMVIAERRWLKERLTVSSFVALLRFRTGVAHIMSSCLLRSNGIFPGVLAADDI